MGRRKLNYSEGDLFRVPLPEGHAVGLVARADGGGGILAYFFPPDLNRPPQLEDAMAIGLVSDLFLMGDGEGRRGTGERRWLPLGHLDGFSRAAWPLPLFVRTTGPRLVQYDENTLEEIADRPAPPQDRARYPEDGLWGAGFAEKRLARLLRERHPAAAA